jgi:hypothetical protein
MKAHRVVTSKIKTWLPGRNAVDLDQKVTVATERETANPCMEPCRRGNVPLTPLRGS